jgi:hypothetical protein
MYVRPRVTPAQLTKSHTVRSLGSAAQILKAEDPAHVTISQWTLFFLILIGRAVLETNKKATKSVSQLYRPSDRLLSQKLVPNFDDRGCHVVSMMNPYGRILGFLDRSSYFFFQVAPQLYSRGWVGPVPNPLHLRKSGSDGNITRTSESVARNSDH